MRGHWLSANLDAPVNSDHVYLRLRFQSTTWYDIDPIIEFAWRSCEHEVRFEAGPGYWCVVPEPLLRHLATTTRFSSTIPSCAIGMVGGSGFRLHGISPQPMVNKPMWVATLRHNMRGTG